MVKLPNTIESLAAEAVGTFMLVAVGGGAGVAATLAGAAFGEALLIAALAHGLVLAVIVNVFGRVSGAHANPAVTIGLASVNRFPWLQVPGYIIAQFVGAIVAVLAIVGMFGNKAFTLAAASAPALGHGVNGAQGLLAEALGAFMLLIAVVATVADSRFHLPSGWAGLIIGLGLASGIFLAGSVSGAGLNPALAVGPYIVDLIHNSSVVQAGEIPVYLFGPVIGGVVAAWIYRFVTRMPMATSQSGTQRSGSKS
jgi:glycerol uptake facilitator protein